MITIREHAHIWTVGILEPDDEWIWIPLRDCSTVDEAMAWLSYLNGGDHPRKPFPPETV